MDEDAGTDAKTPATTPAEALRGLVLALLVAGLITPADVFTLLDVVREAMGG